MLSLDDLATDYAEPGHSGGCDCDDCIIADECECEHRSLSCKHHNTHVCVKCGKREHGADIVQLHEPMHPGCVQKWIDEGEFTREELADFVDVLAAAGVVFRAEEAE